MGKLRADNTNRVGMTISSPDG